MLRRLFTVASVLSLLLFVAVAAMWVRSRFVRDVLQEQTHDYFCFSGAMDLRFRNVRTWYRCGDVEQRELRQGLALGNRAGLLGAHNPRVEDNALVSRILVC